MRLTAWILLLFGTAISTISVAQEIATSRSAIIVLVDDSAVRTGLEDDLVTLARSHRYDAVAGHAIVPDIGDLTDAEPRFHGSDSQ
jgi:hypothetical protein